MNRDELITALLARWAMANPGEATKPSSLADYRDQIARFADEELQAMWHGLHAQPGQGGATTTQDPNKIIAFAQGQIGKRYAGPIVGEADAARWGDPGFDCSSFVSAAYRELGVKLTPFTDTAAKETTKIDPNQAQPGDVIFYRYNDPSQPGVTFPHMGIYAGNGQMIDASIRGGVAVRPLLNQPYEIHRVPGADLMQATYGPSAPAGTAQGPAQTPGGRIQFSPYDDVFLKYMPPDLQNDDRFRAIVAAAAKAESGFDPNKVGDGGKSLGLFQMHEAGAGAGLGAARADPDVQARVMIPKFAEAYRRFKAQYSDPKTGALTVDPAHFAALVAGYAERPQGTDANGILAAGSAAYNNYAAAWGDVSGGGGNAARPYTGAQTTHINLTPVTGDMLGSPQGISQGIFDTWTSAMQQVEGLDPTTDAVKIKAIMDAAKAQTDVLTWVQDRADKVGYQTVQNEIAAGHLQLGREQLAQTGQQFSATQAQQRDFHTDDVRLAMARLAQSDSQFAQTHGLALQQFEQVALPESQAQIEHLQAQTAQGAAALTGEYNGQPTIAARTLEEQIAQHRDTLRAGFADLTSRQAQAQEEAQRMAEVEKGKLLGQALPAGTEFVPGMEPGGTGAQIASMLGTAFTPTRYTPTFVDPGAGLDALRAAFERARQAHPGAPVPA